MGITFGLALIISYPLVVAFLFATIYILYQLIYAEDGVIVFQRHQSYLYVFFLFIVSLLILLISIHIDIINDILGALPEIHIYTLLLTGLSIFTGYFTYNSECKISAYLIPFLKKIFHERGVKGLVRTDSFPKSRFVWIALSIIISVLEEFIWRGFLITALVDEFQFSLLNGLLVSSFLFGINHYYFGIQNVLLKMISGFIWGSLYLQTLNIVYPMIAHTVFNIIVYRRSISCKST